MLCDSVLFNCFLATCRYLKLHAAIFFSATISGQWKDICQNFVCAVKRCFPELMNKPKIHYLLHLVDNMSEFGPCSAFSAQRCVCMCV